MLTEKYEVVQGLLHGFDYSKFFVGTASQRVEVIPAAIDFILQQDDGERRFVQAVILSIASGVIPDTEQCDYVHNYR